MHVRTKPRFALTAIAVALLATGCGSSSDPPTLRDGSVDLPAAPPDASATAPDGPRGNDTSAAPDTVAPRLDVPMPADAAVDATGTAIDGPLPAVDLGNVAKDGAASEAGAIDLAGVRPDGGTGVLDTALPSTDAPLDAAADGFNPGPATPIVVNSSNTGVYNQADGTWKVFYFDATAGQLYCVSKLGGIVTAYVSTSASVSPTNYQYATNADGTLAFTAATAQRYYIAIAASGGSGSGSFQVADGGRLLALGANTVSLTAPNADDYHFFRFPISTGHGYSISMTGPTTTTVGVGVSPQAERASNGQFSTPLWGIGGPLPITNEAIPSSSVALSYSGFYYLFIRVYTAMTVTVTLTQTS